MNAALKKYISTGDLDSKHRLIEAGEESISLIESNLRGRLSYKEMIRLLDVAKEIRIPRSAEILYSVLDAEDGVVWAAAFEAYCYNAPKNRRARLVELREFIKKRDPKDKRLVRISEAIEQDGRNGE